MSTVTVRDLLAALDKTRATDLATHFTELFAASDPAATVEAVPTKDQLLLVVTSPTGVS